LHAVLSAATRTRFSHAVIELRLQDGHGIALIERLRARHPPMRMVVITGFDSFASVIVALRAGASDYLPKPIDEAELMDALLGRARTLPSVPEMPLGVDRVRWERTSCGCSSSAAAT
jgi:two-component system response regulator RegA